MSEALAPPRSNCANCDAALDGPYCAVCGQSSDAINRPAVSLAADFADDAFDWDGRLLRTVRALYLRPGKVARAYIDGKRARFTPPIRLYLLASVLFFVVVAALNIRVIAIDYQIEEGAAVTRDSLSITLRAFERGEPPPGHQFTPDERARYLASVEETDDDVARALERILIAAVENPREVEAAVARSAANALFAVVAAFVLLTMVLHPRRRLIEHVVHALYFHAAHLPAAAILLASAHTLSTHVSGLAGGILAGLGLVLLFVAMALFDRGFFGTSVLGLIWRIPLLYAGYISAQTAIAIGLTLIAVL